MELPFLQALLGDDIVSFLLEDPNDPYHPISLILRSIVSTNRLLNQVPHYPTLIPVDRHPLLHQLEIK